MSSSEHWLIVNNNRNVVSNTPEQLWTNAVEYFKWCDDNPIQSKVTLTSGKEAGKVVRSEKRRPYSIKGLCLHCNILEEYIRDIRQSKKSDSDYYVVVSKILYLIYVQNLENAMVDNFNPVLVSKVLNMEKEDAPSSGLTITVVGNNQSDGRKIPELSFSENQILEKLEMENSLFQKSKNGNL